MAGGSFLTLLDDIASVLDDVAAMTKVATRKTAGVLGDDLALNAQQVSGVRADRELPVVWAVAKGSAVNKVILVPAALLISQFLPWAVLPLLMIGGAFLCFEGVEKLFHKFFHKDADAAQKAEHKANLADPEVDTVAAEKAKIKGAIRTDFILSAEIVVISLSTVAEASFGMRLAVLTGISAIMTVGVYGLVAGIVKLDDAGLYLSRKASALARAAGRGLLRGAPLLMKLLGILGTLAMFMVGGGIITHGIPALYAQIHHWSELSGAIGGALLPTLVDVVVGVAVGAVALALFTGVKKLLPQKPSPTAAP